MLSNSTTPMFQVTAKVSLSRLLILTEKQSKGFIARPAEDEHKTHSKDVSFLSSAVNLQSQDTSC